MGTGGGMGEVVLQASKFMHLSITSYLTTCFCDWHSALQPSGAVLIYFLLPVKMRLQTDCFQKKWKKFLQSLLGHFMMWLML